MAKKEQDNFTKYLTIGMVIFVVLTGVFFSIYSNNQKNNVDIPTIASNVSGKAITINPEVETTIVDIWEDFQCPVCKRFEDANKAIIDKLVAEKKIQVNYHILSFLGPESVLLANAASCSADENKFTDFHSLVFANQLPENSGGWTNETILMASKSVGIDSEEFASCVNTNKYGPYVKFVASDGVKKNVNATPTVFVDGKEIDRNTAYFDTVAFEKSLTK